MTQGFYVISNYPYEGAAIEEYNRKRDAEVAYKESIARVTSGYLTGTALVRIEVVKSVGEWK